MTDAQLNRLVCRFLTWRLPTSFNPDGDIVFFRVPNNPWPIGTNLLTYSEAREMLRYVLADLPDATAPATPTPTLRQRLWKWLACQ